MFDNSQGFGRVNLDGVVQPKKPGKVVFVDESASLKTGETHIEKINVKSGEVPLVVVLAYSDFPGSKLINNLNLIVRGPNGVTAGNQSPNTSPNLDANNNVEVVRIRGSCGWSLHGGDSGIQRSEGTADVCTNILRSFLVVMPQDNELAEFVTGMALNVAHHEVRLALDYAERLKEFQPVFLLAKSLGYEDIARAVAPREIVEPERWKWKVACLSLKLEKSSSH